MNISTNIFGPDGITYGAWWLRFGRTCFFLRASWNSPLFGERNGYHKMLLKLGFGWRFVVQREDKRRGTKMSEMEERVAKAISGAPFVSKASLRKARAAIEAMRDPTDTMIDAAQAVGAYWHHDVSENASEWRDEMRQEWQAMIAGALR